ncbi:hypothetical protein CCR94_17035 [Rhodoblastus sphagnicola]|uniref:Uncharacterized protein n=1 Tax=Rhodoblastus sphagnicola TaxID=333368 RepID=A0A2S6N2F5_9HYPH|nr:efflux RND transporter periplasmic adaptor subunit [Rhodoblastus sphagnicola]MBB4197305.1 membrane fusion protein (multidrug efflux system) [Rhodoblastus sphagnicola]PPQ28789.1 hypothetical protein CCR94_17035 [Rhodoblastus sphagnicola]
MAAQLSTLRLTILTLLAAALVPSAALCGEPVRVGVVIAEKRDFARDIEGVGRVSAQEKVEIRARVKGVLKAVKFVDGQAVKAGDPLYEIEPDLFNADLALAQGALARAEASKMLADLQFKRAQELLARQVGTVVQRDQAAAAVQEAEAVIAGARANLDLAKANLGFATIAAPITGRIGMSAVTAGNMVGPDGVLATIVNPDPIRVVFAVSTRDFARLSDSPDFKTLAVTLTLPDGSAYGDSGRIDFVDVRADPAAETVALRGVFPNALERLKDGQTVRALISDKPKTAIAVPRAALLTDKQGAFVLIVAEGKVLSRRVRVEGESGADALVAEGLAGGEAVIVEGQSKTSPGDIVTTVLAGKGGG